MATNVIMPALGVAQQTGKLLKWLKAEGQAVAKGEPLMEIETDKATVEIEAPGSGVLSQVSAQAGEAPSAAPSAQAKAEGSVIHEKAPAAERVRSVGEMKGESRAAQPAPMSRANHRSASSSGRVLASPAAKRIAREKGLELAALAGSGPQGSVLAADVLRAAAAEAPKEQVSGGSIVPLTPMRRI